jgi:antitoxin VapB
MRQTAKLFQSGKHQAVRLPRGFHFEGNEVFIRHDKQSGDVILSRKPESLDQFFAFADALDADVPHDFLSNEERQTLPQDRDPFEWYDKS